ncbi:hypothetical protein NRE35_004304 [Salmonella enterica]|nr:hypothetical protein [Salmonella enterica]
MSKDKKLEGSTGLVLYTDGGKDTTSEAAGWGVHGYLYNLLEEKKDRFKKDKAAYGQYGYVNGTKTTATFKPGLRLVEPGGLYKLVVNEPKSMPSAPVTPVKFFDFYEPAPGQSISQVEMRAMEVAIDLIIETGVVQAVIVADSEYVCKSLTEYIFGWLKRGWIRSNGKVVEHADTWKRIWEKLTKLREAGVVVRIGWTRSHVGEPGNEAADACATRGKIAVYNALSGERRECLAANYGQKKKLSNRLLEQRWWYGINNELSNQYDEFPGKHVYYFGNHGKAEEEDDLIGKFTSTAKIAILVTPEAEPVLDMLNSYLYDRYYDEVGTVTLGYLEHITNTERYAQLLQDERAALYPRGNKCVYTPDGVPVMKELRPTFHGLRLLDQLSHHLNILQRFSEQDESITVTDITDIVYTRTDNGKKIVVDTAECINAPHKTVRLEVAYKCMKNEGKKTIPFKMGQDIPLRNTLKAILSSHDDIKVYAITWQRSSNEFRYGTVVKAGEDLLLTCSLASNLVTLVGLK